jgi:hypothetical protein
MERQQNTNLIVPNLPPGHITRHAIRSADVGDGSQRRQGCWHRSIPSVDRAH